MASPAESSSSTSTAPPVSEALARAHRVYWRTNLALIAMLMAVGFVVSFVLPLFAQRLESMRVAGFPLPFYFGAQGTILVYVALIAVYIVLMRFADARLLRAVRAEQTDAAA